MNLYAACIILLSFIFGFLLGRYAYHNSLGQYSHVEKMTNGFTKKGVIVGKVEKLIFRKERSTVYLLSIDNFDNFDKNNENPLNKGKNTVEQSGFYPFTSVSTIFIDVPSNMNITPGDVIEFEGTPKSNIQFPLKGYGRYAFLHGGYTTVFVPSFRFIVDKNPTLTERIKERWENIFFHSFPREIAGISLGMTIGSTRYLTTEVKESFLASGITHILVVSGSNIAFLILFLSFFTKYIPMHRWLNYLIISLFVILYILLVGVEVPSVRAAIMGLLSYGIVTGGYRASSRAILGISLVILTIIEPLSPVYDAGFGLSFSATLGIILFQKYGEKYFQGFRMTNWFAPALSLTLGASFGSLPILLYHFGGIPLNSIITNILVAGFLGWILFWSTLFGLLSMISLPFLEYLGLVVYMPTLWVMNISDFLKNGYQLQMKEDISLFFSIFLLGILIYFYVFDDDY